MQAPLHHVEFKTRYASWLSSRVLFSSTAVTQFAGTAVLTPCKKGASIGRDPAEADPVLRPSFW